MGDILELWDPEEDDKNYVTGDVLATISILSTSDYDIIYIIGNHDEDLLDLKKVLRKKGVKHINRGKGAFKMFYRSFPKTKDETGTVKGIVIGKKSYAFLHGHQFDRFQIFYKLSRFLSKKLNKQIRIDPIDWFQDLANVSFTKSIGMKLNGSTLIFCLLLVLYGLAGYYWFKDTPIGSGSGILWIVISSFFVLTIFPKVVTFLNTEIWRRMPGTIVKKCKCVEEVIKERYVDKKGEKIDADIIVFGHTHNAGYYQKEPEKNGRLFINTGCWVKLSKKCIEREAAISNTFLYIDAESLYLLKWDEENAAKGEIECIKDFQEVLS
ncbi:MAG: hypothetical protein DNFNHJIP_00369 [Candidatus Argoarchaeum ethanivorans]|uniref:Calcineurin-like phosphoesterase domain-containing protein n=1 Tax=Candidatus Argoarchaeum ethanivorans TaxID=2608793 RepID=A0A812A1D5_9EURY|nr:MAG: hypothetical protein DNFNHJIP_00369 [Candidatus Argoarchaeum ethanivorans]